ILVNLESLNMAESVGNVTRHRKAPVVVEGEDGEYKLIYVPVVSGMSLAHHYQLHLARAAAESGLNVTRLSLEGYFLKFSDDDVIKNHYPEVHGKLRKGDLCHNEKVLVEACTVADVGGFLYTNGPIKRQSRFSFSYMMPTLDSIRSGAAGVYPQLHVRYTPQAREGEQALIYVDNASALYTLSFLLEADAISRLDVCSALGKSPSSLGEEERIKRFDAAVKALVAMLGNMAYGAKRSRSMPHWSVESLVAVAAEGLAPFVPSPGHSRNYIVDTLNRVNSQARAGIIREWKAAFYATQDLEKPSGADEAKTIEDALKTVAEWALEKLKP
ncbi:type I-A CRISPR-associated protein Cas7/Csa2, partial [Aeropyrum pernix]